MKVKREMMMKIENNVNQVRNLDCSIDYGHQYGLHIFCCIFYIRLLAFKFVTLNIVQLSMYSTNKIDKLRCNNMVSWKWFISTAILSTI